MKSAKQIVQEVVESREFQCYFNPGDPTDTALYDFLCTHCDDLDKIVSRDYKKNVLVVSQWVTDYLKTTYPGTKWSVIDYFQPWGSWHHLLVQQDLTEEDIALSGDIMNVAGITLKLTVSSRHPASSSAVETEETFLGI